MNQLHRYQGINYYYCRQLGLSHRRRQSFMRSGYTTLVVDDAYPITASLSRASMSLRSQTAVAAPPTPLFPAALRSYSTSSLESFHSLALDPDDDDLLVTEEGVRHVQVSLNAKKYIQLSFAIDLTLILSSLRIPTWQTTKEPILPKDLQIRKVSGSMTNAVFFVSHPTARTLLLRIYGQSSASLISRPRELHTLHVLSSKYHIGPHVYGTFTNGRIEEYFESVPLTASDLRDQTTSEFIAARMAELHRVDITTVEGPHWDLGVSKNIRSWIGLAKDTLTLADPPTRSCFDLEEFASLWEKYWNWVRHWEKEYGESPRVFAHNDAQYGNLLRLVDNITHSRIPHHRIIVVDFEYASPNPAAFDIANHFHEWTANYHSSTPWLLQPSMYPSHSQRRTFFKAYLQNTLKLEPTEDELILLEYQVRAWSPASHAMWAIWGIVQAREELETDEKADFNYLEYAKGRIERFKHEIAMLHI